MIVNILNHRNTPTNIFANFCQITTTAYLNKPRQGLIYHSMESARARLKYALRVSKSLKYALRATKQAEKTARADALANFLCGIDQDGFWKVVSKSNQK